MTEKTTRRLPDFGAWVKRSMDHAGLEYTELSRVTEISYPQLSDLLNSGARGEPRRPRADTIERIARGLIDLQVITDSDDAWRAAGYHIEGGSQSGGKPELTIAGESDPRDLAAYNNAPPEIRRAYDELEQAKRRLLDPFAPKRHAEEQAANRKRTAEVADEPDGE